MHIEGILSFYNFSSRILVDDISFLNCASGIEVIIEENSCGIFRSCSDMNSFEFVLPATKKLHSNVFISLIALYIFILSLS